MARRRFRLPVYDESGKQLKGSRSKSLSLRQLRTLKIEPVLPYERPKTRADCEYGIRPCPFVGCKYNLYLDVTKAGSIKLNFPDLEPDDMTLASCVLDAAEYVDTEFEPIAIVLNVSRQRVEQIEKAALEKLRHVRESEILEQFLPLVSTHYQHPLAGVDPQPGGADRNYMTGA